MILYKALLNFKELFSHLIGLMPTDKLQSLFSRSVIFQSDDMQSYVISLMNKFELALVWDNSSLLIPCLLPSENEKDHRKFVSVSTSLHFSKSYSSKS